MSEVELSILIVNWNGREVLADCLESILAAPPAVPYEIVVVDNGSSDGSQPYVRSMRARASAAGTRIHLIANAENAGFSKANNQGFEHSAAPFLLLLNSDTEVTPGAIDRLLELAKSTPRIGACGPRLHNSDGSLQHSVWRNPPTAWETLVLGFKLERLLPRRLRGELLLGAYWDHDRRRRVRRLTGAAVLVKREVLDQVGGLDERFHMYGEDVEWCLRIVRAGWSIVFEPEAVIVHHGSQSSRARWGEGMSRVSYEGFLRFQRYSLSAPHFLLNLLTQYFVLVVQLGWRRLRRYPEDPIERGMRMVMDVIRAELRATGRGRPEVAAPAEGTRAAR